MITVDRGLELASDRLRAAVRDFRATPCRGTAAVLSERFAVYWRRRNGGSVGLDIALEQLEAKTEAIVAKAEGARAAA